MRPPVKYLLVLAMIAAGCGKQIGDSCIVNSDCSPQGDRICDTQPLQGYCTIMGCDYDTCPNEAVCVRFFTGSFANKPCDPTMPTVANGCSLDELCTLEMTCAPRSAESRYCMKKCNSSGDCRSGYECRDLTLMKDHGGEPVLAPGLVVDESSPKFCASAPQTM